MEGLLEPEEVEETVGTVEIRADSSRLRRSARSPARWSPRARSRRGATVRLVRDGTIVYDGRRSAACAASRTTSARSRPAMECGIVLENFEDVKEGDVLEVVRDAPGRARRSQ